MFIAFCLLYVVFFVGVVTDEHLVILVVINQSELQEGRMESR